MCINSTEKIMFNIIYMLKKTGPFYSLQSLKMIKIIYGRIKRRKVSQQQQHQQQPNDEI